MSEAAEGVKSPKDVVVAVEDEDEEESSQQDFAGEVFFANDSSRETPKSEAPFVVVAPSGIAADDNDGNGALLGSLKHPRHSKLCSFAVVKDQLCEVQEHKPIFGTWFVDNAVVPEQPLVILTKVDPTFFSLWLARQGNTEQFVAADEIMGVDSRLSSLPNAIVEEIKTGLRDVCEAKSAGGEEFFRYSEECTLNWLKGKVSHLADSGVVKPLIGTEDATINTVKSHSMVCEYVDKSLHEKLLERCGVNADAGATAVASSHGSHYGAGKTTRDDDEGLEKKKSKKEAPQKSLNVRRLEKAGPPKGTPSIMSFFKKK